MPRFHRIRNSRIVPRALSGLFIIFACFTALSNTPQVLALSATQKSTFDSGIDYYDTDVSGDTSLGGSCSSSTTLVGSDGQEQTWNYFKGKGLSDAQVAGIMGNIQQESGFNPEVMENGGQSPDPYDAGDKGWGIIQWSGNGDTGRSTGDKFYSLFQQSGVQGAVYELSTQLDLVWQHMNNHPDVTGHFDLNHYQQITSETEAALYFEKYIEGGTDPNGVRESNATKILQQYGGSGGSGSGDTADTTGCGNSISPNCQSAAGVARILCDAQQYDPVSYSETYQGGHQGGSAWHSSCPTIDASCILDCSGLVNIAVYDVYGADLRETTYTEASDSQYWQHIPFDQLQSGDLVQPAAEQGGHVEIVDHVAGQLIYTFGAHSANRPQPDQVGPDQIPVSTGDVYLHYVGPGA